MLRRLLFRRPSLHSQQLAVLVFYAIRIKMVERASALKNPGLPRLSSLEKHSHKEVLFRQKAGFVDNHKPGLSMLTAYDGLFTKTLTSRTGALICHPPPSCGIWRNGP